MHYLVVLVPILTAIVVAITNRFKSGHTWINLRSSAEAIKREIYTYRIRASRYWRQNPEQSTADTKLARHIEAVNQQLIQTDIGLMAFQPYTGPIPPVMYVEGDDGIKFLSPHQYMTFRLEDQLAYYRCRATRAAKRVRRLQWLIYILGGVGSILAVMEYEVWIALTTALAAAFVTFLEYRQEETTLLRYNQAAMGLENVRAWWRALSSSDQAQSDNIDKLVERTEKILHSEHAGWVESMQEALVDLQEERHDQADATERNGTHPQGADSSVPRSGETGSTSE